MANEPNAHWQYRQALWELSDLVMRRNHLLLRLSTLASLPLGLIPASGMVAEFNSDAARALLADIDAHTRHITKAMNKANQLAGAAGDAPVTWRRSPTFPEHGEAD